jgi:CheY-like chemotaxis protein
MTAAADTSDDTVRGLDPAAASYLAAYRLSRRLDAFADGCLALERQLRRWLVEHDLRRSVLVVDDTPAVLAALVATLASVGVPVHAVTDDRDAASLLLLQGAATVRIVDGWAEVPDVWRELRCAVIVTDLYLSDGETGLDLLDAVGRGPRSVVVTSHSHARQTLDRAATLVHAEGVIRTDTGAWQETLRATVLRMLDETTPYSGGDDDA